MRYWAVHHSGTMRMIPYRGPVRLSFRHGSLTLAVRHWPSAHFAIVVPEVRHWPAEVWR